MKHFLKILYAGLVNLYIAGTCVGLFYAGIILFIKTYSAKGFAAIGMFLLGIILIFIGILFLYLMGLIFECMLNNYDNNNKNKEDKE